MALDQVTGSRMSDPIFSLESHFSRIPSIPAPANHLVPKRDLHLLVSLHVIILFSPWGTHPLPSYLHHSRQ